MIPPDQRVYRQGSPPRVGDATGPTEYNPRPMPIRVLRPDVAAKIAAGEVIERPASVVKELVENSLDAGAKRVAVDIAGGGTDTIRVLDDGRGIPGDEVELAFRRFATSKVTGLADLEAIRSLGFRGEALASIAAVSRVELVTKTRSAEAATEIEVAEGEILRVATRGAAEGTCVTVRDLFASFPARRKFLSSSSSEASRARTLVQRYALAYPGVSFELKVDGRRAVSTSGSDALLDAVAEVYSPGLAAEMLPVHGGRPGVITVTGLSGAPTVSRSTRAHISLFVNGRWIQSGRLGHAVEQAYHGFLGDRRIPVAVIGIQVDPTDLDVNVHPAKVEVRFRREREVYGEVQRAVREALTRYAPVPRMGGEGPARAIRERSGAMWTSTLTKTEGPSDHAARAASTEGQERTPYAPMASVLPAMRVLGQSQMTYIVAEGPDGLYLFDQHAAHERVLYERIGAGSSAAASQALLVPVEIDLSDLEPEVGDALVSTLEILAEIGFEIEPFGPMTYRLRALPAAMGVVDPAGGLVEALRDVGRSAGRTDRRESLVRRVACHGAVKAGLKMAGEEMEELIRLLEACSQPHSCPHGRPTTIHLSEARLQRDFGRA